MNQRRYSFKPLIIIIIFLVFGISLIFSSTYVQGIKPKAEEKEEKSEIPEEYKTIITGRILYADKSPIVGISVSIYEASTSKWGNDAIEYYESSGALRRIKNSTMYLKEENIYFTMKVRNGKSLNPEANTDSMGRFKILADCRFWEETGMFTIKGGLLPGTMINASILRGLSGEPVLIKIDKNTRKYDLGDIVVNK